MKIINIEPVRFITVNTCEFETHVNVMQPVMIKEGAVTLGEGIGRNLF